MSRIKLAGALLLASLPLMLVGSAGAYHTSTCSTSGVRTAKTAQGTADVLEPGATHSYSVTFPAGAHYIAVTSNGDIDMNVCKVGASAGSHVCKSENVAGAPDTCLVAGASGNPGAGPPITGPGTFRIDLKYCFDAACGYADHPVPLAYVLGWN